MSPLTILTFIIIIKEEDELEFSVCLPSPTLEPSAFLTDDRTEPVVFILGFEVPVHRYHHHHYHDQCCCLLNSWL